MLPTISALPGAIDSSATRCLLVPSWPALVALSWLLPAESLNLLRMSFSMTSGEGLETLQS